MQRSTRINYWLQCMLAVGASLPVAAQEAVPTAPAVPLASVAERPAATPFSKAVVMNDARLQQLRGGSDAPWTDQKLTGAVTGNSAISVATGANIITDGAFTNAAGLPMVIQNSGANVLIQNATIVNVQIK